MGADNKMTKCGEILIDLKKRHKKSRIYTFHCTFCETSWDQMKKFSMHVEAVHFKNFKEETHDIPIIFEPEIKIETPADDRLLQAENKMSLNDIVKEDPLEMEEVPLESNQEDDNKKIDDIQVKDEDVKKDEEVDIKLEEYNENYSDDNEDDDNKALKEVCSEYVQ